jgi:hypothetical protein
VASGQYEFGAYRLDAQSRMLFKDGDHVPLPFGGAPQPRTISRLPLTRLSRGAGPLAGSIIDTWESS